MLGVLIMCVEALVIILLVLMAYRDYKSQKKVLDIYKHNIGKITDANFKLIQDNRELEKEILSLKLKILEKDNKH